MGTHVTTACRYNTGRRAMLGSRHSFLHVLAGIIGRDSQFITCENHVCPVACAPCPTGRVPSSPLRLPALASNPPRAHRVRASQKPKEPKDALVL